MLITVAYIYCYPVALKMLYWLIERYVIIYKWLSFELVGMLIRRRIEHTRMTCIESYVIEKLVKLQILFLGEQGIQAS